MAKFSTRHFTPVTTEKEKQLEKSQILSDSASSKVNKLQVFELNDIRRTEFGCLAWINKFSKHHNQELEYKPKNLQNLFPHVNIFYGDYYDILSKLVHAPTKYGLGDGLVPLRACCGGGGPYNWNRSLSCGNEGATVCANPSQYIYWDGAHPTEAAFGWIAKSLLSDEPFATIF